MLKSTKKILEELYEISPSLKWDEEKLKNLIVFLEQHNPKVVVSKQFREKLWRKLTTIWEFKQIQPKTKWSFMSIMRPLFLMVFWVFALLQFQNFLSMDQVDMKNLPPQNVQDFTIEPKEDSIKSEDLVLEESKSSEQSIENIIWEIAEDKEQPQNTWDSILSDETETQESIVNTSETAEKKSSKKIENNEKDSSELSPWTIDQSEKQNEEPSKLIWTDVSEVSDVTPPDLWNELDLMPSNDPISSPSEIQMSEWLWEDNSLLDQIPTTVNEEPMVNDVDESFQSDVMDFAAFDNSDTTFGDYYSCTNGKIDIEDSVHQRKIIKAYCEVHWGEILNDKNIEYYLCKLQQRQEVGIDYIERDLCQ